MLRWILGGREAQGSAEVREVPGANVTWDKLTFKVLASCQEH